MCVLCKKYQKDLTFGQRNSAPRCLWGESPQRLRLIVRLKNIKCVAACFHGSLLPSHTTAGAFQSQPAELVRGSLHLHN